MEVATPLTSLWIWIPVTSLAIIGFIVASLERHIRALFGNRVWAAREVERAEKRARRKRIEGLEEITAYARSEPLFGKPAIDFENQSVSGELHIPRSYKDWLFSVSVRIGNWRWLRRCALVSVIVQRIGTWAGYSIK